MSKKHLQQSTPMSHAGSGKKRRGTPGSTPGGSIAVIGLLGLAVVAVALGVLQPQLFPHYWTSENLGPIKTNSSSPDGSAPEGMVWIPGGTFWMGTEEFSDARPIHKVSVDGFWMD